MTKNTIGQFIAALRKANGMTQQEVADRLSVSNKAVSRWERDECAPDLSVLPSLAEMFGVTCDELLRGERNNSDREESVSANRQKAKSEKQFNLILYKAKKKFTNLSFISIGLVIFGLIAAAICNYVFFRSVLGFALASVFFVAAMICQLCFTVSFRLLVDNDSQNAEQIKKANTYMVLATVKIFFATLLTWASCLPLVVLTFAYNTGFYGLMLLTWLFYGVGFAVIAFLILFCIYRLGIIKSLIKKEIVYLSETEKGKLNGNNELLKKCCLVFVSVFAILIMGLITISVIHENNGFTEIKKFTDPDEFITYVQTQYDEWYKEDYDEVDITVGINSSEFHDNGDSADITTELDEKIPDSEYLCWDKIDGKEYYYNPELYKELDVVEYEPGKYDITIITNQAFHDAGEIVGTINAILFLLIIVNLFVCVLWYCVGTRKQKAKML